MYLKKGRSWDEGSKVKTDQKFTKKKWSEEGMKENIDEYVISVRKEKEGRDTEDNIHESLSKKKVVT